MELFITILFLILHLACAASVVERDTIVVPAPDGPYGVDATQMVVLTDTSRDDPYAPKKEKRTVVLSAYYPVAAKSDCKTKLTKYMPDNTAKVVNQAYLDFGIPQGTLASIRLSMCGISDRDKYKSDHPGFAKKDFPIVFFSPGNNAYRFGYSAIAQSIAAQGYVVISMDHPYDAAVLEYPDGHLVFLSPEADGQPSSEIPKMIDTRVKDLQFVLTQLGKKSVVKSLAPGVWDGDAPPNLGHVPICGHSEGGGAALTAMQRDERFIGGLNYDGGLESVPYDKSKGLKLPYIYFASQTSGKNEPALLKVFPSLKWALNLFLKKSQHGTFTDLPLLAHVLGLEPLTGAAAQVYGKVKGDRAMEIITAYTTAFLKFVLNDEKTTPSLLDPTNQNNDPNVAEFQEVLYLRWNP